MPIRLLLWLLLLVGLAPAHAQPAKGLRPGEVRVRLVTSAGPIVVAVDTRRAPITARNFLAYVDDGRFIGTTIYRAARKKTAAGQGFIQGGIRTDARRMLPPVTHEPTTRTGIRHEDAIISMARRETVTASGNFFITAGPHHAMDARPGYQGFAAFGRVISGMDVVRRILALPTGGGTGAMRGQMILRPVTLIRAERLDGKARPTTGVRPWLIPLPVRKQD